MEEREFDACIRRIQAGEQEALKKIYEAYAALIYSVIYDMTQQREDAQDLTSEFFIRLWERADSYRFGGKHRGWLLTIARNMTIDFLRKRNRELPTEEIPEPDTHSEDVAETVVGRMSMQEAMDRLKPGEQEVLDMKILGQMTFQEISEVIKKPMGTVTWLYRQGIGKLKRYHKREQEVQE